jgi:hypothetical protein
MSIRTIGSGFLFKPLEVPDLEEREELFPLMDSTGDGYEDCIRIDDPDLRIFIAERDELD